MVDGVAQGGTTPYMGEDTPRKLNDAGKEEGWDINLVTQSA